MDITDKILKENRDIRNLARYLHRLGHEQNSNSIQDEILEYESNVICFDVDTDDLEFDIREIQRQSYSYVFIGLRLKRLFLTKRYLQKFATVKDFCQQVLGRTLAYAKRLIKAAEVAVELARAGFTQLPLCEAQARPLTKLEVWSNALNPEESPLCQKWQEIIASANAQPITAELVKAAVEGSKTGKKRITISDETYSNLEKIAANRGFTSIEAMIESLARGEELPPDELPPCQEEPVQLYEKKGEYNFNYNTLQDIKSSFLQHFSAGKKSINKVLSDFIDILWLEITQSGFT